MRFEIGREVEDFDEDQESDGNSVVVVVGFVVPEQVAEID